MPAPNSDTSTRSIRSDALLQQALRLSIEAFADHLNVSSRTVARWHQATEIVPRPAVQQLLDQALRAANTDQQRRFEALREATSSPVAAALQAALAVVIHDDNVLLVRPLAPDTASWQFPAGIVKPGASAEAVAVRETLSETGIDCAVRGRIGSRTHPVTGVFCVYLRCDYLAGEPENRDPFENMNVRWVPTSDISRFIPEDRIYPPVLAMLQETA